MGCPKWNHAYWLHTDQEGNRDEPKNEGKKKKRKIPEEKGEEKPKGRRKHAHRPWKSPWSSGKGDDEEGIRSMERKSMLSAGRKKNNLPPHCPRRVCLSTLQEGGLIRRTPCALVSRKKHICYIKTRKHSRDVNANHREKPLLRILHIIYPNSVRGIHYLLIILWGIFRDNIPIFCNLVLSLHLLVSLMTYLGSIL